MALRITLILNILLQLFALLNHSFTTADPTYLDSRCSHNMVYAPNSKQQINLNAVFYNLTSTAATATSGTNANNNVFGLFLCRGDLTVTSCRDCVTAATLSLAHSYCPFKKAGVIWYTECMVRYSNESFLRRMEDFPRVIISNSRNIIGNQSRFTEILDGAMNDMIVHSRNTTFYKNVFKITRFHTLTAFSQCTPELTENDCTRCLKIAVSQLPVSITGSVLQPSCNIWYEINRSDILSILPSNIIKNPSAKDRVSTRVFAAIFVPLASVLVAVLALCVIVNRTRIFKAAVRNADNDGIEIESLRYDMSTLQSATNNFHRRNRLRSSTSGSVYKGILSDGTEIAVRRIFWSRTDFEDPSSFNGVLSYAKLQHRNLQRFLGFCVDGNDWFLVFEYLPYDLTRILFDRDHRQVDWGTRFEIIKGIARGILYLHQNSRLRIIHRKITSDTVLLDKNMNPKLSDFSNAKILPLDQPQLQGEPILGNDWYLSPELYRGQLSVESDVYSFGKLILEIIRGRRFFNRFDVNDADYSNSPEGVGEKWREGKVMEVLDEAIRDSDSIGEKERCIHLGLLCVERFPDKRPTMETVIVMLESHSATLPMPEQPAYMSQKELNGGDPDQSVTMRIPGSVDVATITQVEPR